MATRKKKLRNGHFIEVDEQILRWRKLRKLKQIALGRATERQDRLNAKKREEAAKPAPEKRKWF